MRRLAIALLFLCPQIPAGRAQSPEACPIRELFNRRGWDIPGLSKAVLEMHAHYVSDGVPKNVFVDVLKPRAPESGLMTVSRISGETARLEVLVMPIDMTRIQRFTMNGHIFGYHVTAVDAGYDKNRKRTHFGYQELVYYYDPDGAGKFSVMRYAGELPFTIIVPEWVKSIRAVK